MSRACGLCLQAPSGYDSVIGEPGEKLNYDEAIGAFCVLCNGFVVLTVGRASNVQYTRSDWCRY